MKGPRFRNLSLVLAAVLVAAVASACSSSPTSKAQDSSAAQGPGLTTVTVDVLDIPDVVALRIAQDKGFFKQQGLNVKVTYVASTADALEGFLAHTVDFSLENYVGAMDQEISPAHPQFEYIADANQATPNGWVVMVPKNSKITSLAELKGKTIAFPAPGWNIGSLSLDAQLRGYGLGPDSYKVDPMAFPDMLAPMARGEIDAAFATQPFITIMEAKLGAHPLADLMTGELANFPVAGWATDQWYLQRYPKTVAAFQRAILEGQQVAATNQATIRATLPEYIKTLTPQIANVMPLGAYNTTISLTRLQRVADVLEQFGVLPSNFNVSSMVAQLPSGA